MHYNHFIGTGLGCEYGLCCEKDGVERITQCTAEYRLLIGQNSRWEIAVEIVYNHLVNVTTIS